MNLLQKEAQMIKKKNKKDFLGNFSTGDKDTTYIGYCYMYCAVNQMLSSFIN